MPVTTHEAPDDLTHDGVPIEGAGFFRGLLYGAAIASPMWLLFISWLLR